MATPESTAADPKARSVRDYRADTGGRWGLNRSGRTVPGEQSLSKPTSRLNPSVHPAVRADCGFLGHATGLDKASYGTHTLRRTKATLIYRRTKNLRSVQLLLGHTKLESTVRYLGIEVNDALEMAEQTEV